MTATTAETVTVDGLTLNTLAYNIQTLDGRLGTPDVRTKNAEIAGRHGTLRVRGKKFQESTFVWSMWVRGCNPDGSVPDSSVRRSLFWDNVDLLSQVFTRRSGSLDIRQSKADGSIRQCYGEVLAAMSPKSSSSNPMGTFSVAVTIPGCFWQDLNTVTYTTSAGLTNQTLILSPFIGATAPMEDLVWTFTGAGTNMKVQALENGSPLEIDTWMQYTNAVTSAEQLVVDCGAWTVVGGGGFTASTAALSHSGSSAFMALQPGPQLTAPQVAFSGTSLNSHTQLSVTGRRKYVTI